MPPPPQSNFSFLADHNPPFLQLAEAAECSFAGEPNTTLIKLRRLGQAIAHDLATQISV